MPDEVAAEELIAASPEGAFAFLADLENHWRLTGRYIEVESLDGPPGARHGGVVRIRGPLGVRRTATTRVLSATPPREMLGSARIGRRTEARVRWTLLPGDGAIAVRLSATVESTGWLDGLLLRLGGRRWLRRLFARALHRLAEHLASHSQQQSEDGSPDLGRHATSSLREWM
jgi:hypothetical protein